MIIRKILIILGCIILYPLAVVLGPSIFLTFQWVKLAHREGGVIAMTIACVLFFIPFIIGLIIDICWIPLSIIALPVIFVMSHTI